MLTDLLRSHRHSSRHRAEVLASRECGCFHCVRTFPPSGIREWIDGGETALCPECGIDAVIGSESGCPVGDPRFLRRMYEFWFNTFKGP